MTQITLFEDLFTCKLQKLVLVVPRSTQTVEMTNSPNINLKRRWRKMCNETLKPKNVTIAKKILAYKIFMRPLLIYDWFAGHHDQIKKLEVQALRQIFGNFNETQLYVKYTDIDVTCYMRLQESRWEISNPTQAGLLRSMLHAVSKTADDPLPYFTSNNQCDRTRQHRPARRSRRARAYRHPRSPRHDTSSSSTSSALPFTSTDSNSSLQELLDVFPSSDESEHPRSSRRLAFNRNRRN